MSGYERCSERLSLAGKYRIGLNIVRTGKIGVKGLFLEYGEYSDEYSPTDKTIIVLGISGVSQNWNRIYYKNIYFSGEQNYL